MSANSYPPRSADTMSDAIALSSPSGRTSKRAQRLAGERLSIALFGPGGYQPEPAPQPTQRERLLRRAADLRDLAERGMKPRAFRREAARLEALAAEANS